MSSAPEEFQRKLKYTLEGLNGVTPIFDDTFFLSVGETQPNAIAVHDKKLKAQLQIKQGENKEVKFMRPDKDINIVMSNKDISISIWMKTPLNLKRCDQMYFVSLK